MALFPSLKLICNTALVPVLSEFSSALQVAGLLLPKKTACPQYEWSWLTDRQNSLSGSRCHSQKVFIHLCLGVFSRLSVSSVRRLELNDSNLERKTLISAKLVLHPKPTAQYLHLCCVSCLIVTLVRRHTEVTRCAFLFFCLLFWPFVSVRGHHILTKKVVAATSTSLDTEHDLQVTGIFCWKAEPCFGNGNAKWHGSTFTQLPLCTYKKQKGIEDSVDATPMYEHFSLIVSFFSFFK